MSMLNRVTAIASFCSVLNGVHAWSGQTVDDLHNEYYNIFKTGNRNAASHLWSKFLLDNSRNMTRETLSHMFSGFCAVSGSPVSPQDRTRYKVTLDKVSGGKQTGYMYHCCAPCTCDTKDFIKVDTKTITTSGGHVQQYHFAVIGNPCDHADKLSEPYEDAFNGIMITISQQAPNVRCDKDGKLEGAYVSDNGYVIISMFFDEDASLKSMEESSFTSYCTQRAQSGYASGMGKIFRKVAAISPVVVGANKTKAGIAAAEPEPEPEPASTMTKKHANASHGEILTQLRKAGPASSLDSHHDHNHDHNHDHANNGTARLPLNGTMSSCGMTTINVAVSMLFVVAYCCGWLVSI
jgi:cytochrome c5